MVRSEITGLLEQYGTVLLDTVQADAENYRTLLFETPVRVLEAKTLGEVRGVLHELDDAVAEGFWGAGFMAYEAGFAFERIAPVLEGILPLVWFGIYKAPVALDVWGLNALSAEVSGAGPLIKEARLGMDRAAYRERIGQIKQAIYQGEVYQVNFTDRVDFRFSGIPLSVYAALRARQSVAYGAWINLGKAYILSLSPELFFRRRRQRISVRPMKGTVRRGKTPEEDAALQHALLNDEKNRAENLMIVDLLRNDLSVLCEPGTVRTPALFTAEPYETLSQMTSTVEGTLRAGTGYAEIFRALFPCGSVTGAPKIRAMQYIHQLERDPRGVYCGSIGYAAPGGEAVFSVAIRTAVLQGEHGRLGVGSGIVWDSEAESEYEECLLKARFLFEAGGAGDFQLIETMRWENGTIALYALHLERLASSAAHFGFPFEAETLRAVIEKENNRWPAGAHKIRVLLDQMGTFSIEATPLEPGASTDVRAIVSEVRIDSNDPYLPHKTTRRERQQAALMEARAKGFDEVLFLNERGELTEGAWTNLLVEKDGKLYTPPLGCGLLPGVYRRYLLTTRSDTEERVLTAEDLTTADAVYVCNAVRGLMPVKEVAWGHEEHRQETSIRV